MSWNGEVIEQVLQEEMIKREMEPELVKTSVVKEGAIYYIYTDYTVDEDWSFYWGKGQETRTKDLTPRNPIWERISNKHGGSKRELFMATKDEQYAFAVEIAMIRIDKTFAADWEDGSGWGANMTRGGEGVKGRVWTEEQRKNRSGEGNGMYGYEYSDEQIERLRISSTGRTHTEETKAQLSKSKMGENNPMFGKTGALSHTFGTHPTEETLEKIRGENKSDAKLKTIEVIEIKAILTEGNYKSLEQIAQRYGVGRKAICQIKHNKSWKHIPWPDPITPSV